MDEEAEQYREWLKKGYTKGYRALFRSLKRDQVPYLRPFQHCTVEEDPDENHAMERDLASRGVDSWSHAEEDKEIIVQGSWKGCKT